MSTLIGPGERVLILLPGERPGSVGDLLAAGLQRLGASGVVYGLVQNYSHALEVMVKDSIDALVGIPAQVLALARHSGGRAAPRSVLLSTDHVPDAIRRELERIWGCEVYTHYGMTEMGFGGGVECQAKHGYHMREADLYVEIINPTTGARLEDGKTGEVVFTTLTRRGMPLIRYRTGDLSRFLLEPCPCGTVLKTMECLKRRLEDRVELAPGRMLTIADLDEVLFRIRDLVDFSAAFVREKDLNRLNITTTMMERNSKGRTAEEVEMALQSIPALRSAVDGGALTVSVAVGVGGSRASNSSSKRRITGGKESGSCIMTIFEHMVERLKAKESFVLATILCRCGSAPRDVGSRMLVRSDGSIIGSIGGGILEAKLQELAKELFQSGKTIVGKFSLNREGPTPIGMICGGDVEFRCIWRTPPNLPAWQSMKNF